jgi:hypothetical protein
MEDAAQRDPGRAQDLPWKSEWQGKTESEVVFCGDTGFLLVTGGPILRETLSAGLLGGSGDQAEQHRTRTHDEGRSPVRRQRCLGQQCGRSLRPLDDRMVIVRCLSDQLP